MGRSMYNVTSETVGPVERCLKALVELNAYAAEARDAGWGVTFGVREEDCEVVVAVSRTDDWPTVPEAAS